MQNTNLFTQNIFSGLEVDLLSNDFEIIKEIIQKIEAKFSENCEYTNEKIKGIFTSYDFHIERDGPKLIEINTNAGGAVLFSEYLKYTGDTNYFPNFENQIVEMFKSEWQKSGINRELKIICIVDEDPDKQFLYSEFILIKSILEKHGFTVIISDPSDLKFEKHLLIYQNQSVDFVYNRLTDFYLEKIENIAVKNAFESKKVLVSPNPTHYKTIANKLNLIELQKDEFLSQYIPEIKLIDKENQDEIWQNRKEYFFKPISGHGSRGVYCGEKITSKTWVEIKDNNYLAQKCTKAPKIKFDLNGVKKDYRYDLRFITYNGQIQFIFARLYNGQATNFRTEGGGFAKVNIESLVLDE